MTRRLLMLLVVLVASGCVRRIPAPKPDAGRDPHEAWARVLQTRVNDAGQIDFKAIAKDPADLEAYVAWLAKNGPKSTPEAFQTREQKLAYYLNAYNALCMYNAVKNDVKPKQKIRFFFRTEMPMDGRKITLYALENEIVRPFNEPRIHFILNCMVKGCPRLPRVPMAPETLEAQLETAARLFFSEEPRNVDLKEKSKTVRLSSILKFYTEDFVQPKTDAKNLIAYANKYRDSKIAEDWTVEFIPYDWTLNQSP